MHYVASLLEAGIHLYNDFVKTVLNMPFVHYTKH